MVYTFVKHPLPGLVYIFSLQQFSSIFESTVLLPEDKLKVTPKLLHSVLPPYHCYKPTTTQILMIKRKNSYTRGETVLPLYKITGALRIEL